MTGGIVLAAAVVSKNESRDGLFFRVDLDLTEENCLSFNFISS